MRDNCDVSRMTEKITLERKKELIENKKLQMELGKRIREIRKSKGMNQTELAIKMNNRDRQIVQRLERGGTNVSLNLLRLVAEALEVDIVDLFLLPKEN